AARAERAGRFDRATSSPPDSRRIMRRAGLARPREVTRPARFLARTAGWPLSRHGPGRAPVRRRDLIVNGRFSSLVAQGVAGHVGARPQLRSEEHTSEL